MKKKLSFKEIYDKFYGKAMYKKKIVGNEIKIVPTKHCLKLRLILSEQGDRDEHGRSISAYFCL